MTDDPTSDPTSDDQLRGLLASAAPDGPDLPPAARTAAVRDRARVVRRRQGLAVAAAVLVAVGAVAVPVLVTGDAAPAQVAEDPAPDGPAEPAPCPTDPVDVDGGVGADALPGGAASARLCPAVAGDTPGGIPGGTPDGSSAGPDWSMTWPDGDPADTVVVDEVDSFVTAVRDLPAYESAPECAMTMMAIEPWSVVVSYPDGTSVTLGTTTRSCSSVPVEGVQRSSEGILDAFDDASAQQPAEPSGAPGPSAAALTCPTAEEVTYALTNGEPLDRALDPVDGLVCYLVDPRGGREYAEDSGMLTRDQAQTLWRDFVDRSTERPQVAGRCTDTGPTRVVLLRDADGVVLSLYDHSCTTEFSSVAGYWLAGDEAGAVIDEALGGRVDD